MNILALNVGSSSIKYKVYENDKFIFEGKLERIKDFSEGVRKVIKQLNENEIKIDVIGNRIVHRGFVVKNEVINKDVIKKIKKYSELAPLHNIPELEAVEELNKLKIKQVAVYDSVFYKDLNEKAYMYALPYKYYKKYGIRKIGFHGLSHQYVSEFVVRKFKKNLKIISCHLGAGCSITAIKNGKAIDTSMGFSPCEGLMMGTRCGDIDVAVILFLEKYEKLDYREINKIINEKSGLLGVSGISEDFRDIRANKSKRAKLAREMFEYKIRKYIGAYNAVLNEADVIVFTGAIGENVGSLRKNVSKGFKAKVIVVKTDEEEVIAKEVKKLLKFR